MSTPHKIYSYGRTAEFERKLGVVVKMPPDWQEQVVFTQNTEVPGRDHWLVQLYLDRWRTKSELAAYLRTVAAIVDELPTDTKT